MCTLGTVKSFDGTRSRIARVGDSLELQVRRVHLVVEAGPERGMVVPLIDSPLVIGRSRDTDLRLRDETVSRRHALLLPAEEGWKVRDLQSKGGLFVAGERVEEALLAADDRFQIGDSVLRLEVRDECLRPESRDEDGLHGMLGRSPPMRELFGLVRKVGPLELPVLLHGESGTGKEGVARALHLESPRRERPYEVVDCTLLQGELLRSELFGHEKGAFTGASEARTGAFERADGGTLLLDEVAEIPLALQPTLLRVLEEGEVRRLGGAAPRRVRVRIVSASNRDLAEMVDRGEFRADLYYRLSAVTLEIPPLRTRGGDIEALARSFLEPGYSLAEDARRALAQHPWPGNVRELRSALRRGCGIASGSRVHASDLGLRPVGEARPRPGAAVPPPACAAAAPGAPVARAVEDLEEAMIREAIARCGGNRRKAAAELGMARSTFYYKLKKYGID